MPPTFTQQDLPPHPNNAPGDFFVEDGCCTRCGVPFLEAPELFAENDDHCWVSRQPVTSDESGKMLMVFQHQEFGCIRYRGHDPTWQALDRNTQQKLLNLYNGTTSSE